MTILSAKAVLDEIRGSPRPWLLWVGAGVSVLPPTSAPAAGPFIDALAEVLTGPPDATGRAKELLTRARDTLRSGGSAPLSGSSMPFEAIVAEVWSHTGDFVPRLLERAYPSLDEARPNRIHRAIGRLVPNVFERVITTNFDECLEASSPALGRRLVPVTGTFSPSTERLIKVHGTISDRRSLAATPEGLRQRADSSAWRDSLARLLEGRRVLVVGYSVRDAIDIVPVLMEARRRGTRFVLAYNEAHSAPNLPDLPCDAVPHSLGGESDLLVQIARAAGGAASLLSASTGALGPLSTLEVMIRTADEVGLSTSQRLAAIGAIVHWLELPWGPLAYFEVAAAEEGATIDGHVRARALLRERRYRAAVIEFDKLLATREVATSRRDAEQTVDWCVGAAHCSKAGGRLRRAGAYYRRAWETLRSSGRKPEHLDPYLADQILRGTAGYAIERARRSHRRSRREAWLRLADRLLDRLDSVEGVALTTRPLTLLDRGRIALAREDRETAVRHLGGASATLTWSGDPHGVIVCARLLAVARRDLDGLRRLQRAAWARGQRAEAAKIQFERLLQWAGDPMDAETRVLRDAILVAADTINELGHRQMPSNRVVREVRG
jgi:tetratricopeptide (TPR) repeat protein